jgi:hypothetical protein
MNFKINFYPLTLKSSLILSIFLSSIYFWSCSKEEAQSSLSSIPTNASKGFKTYTWSRAEGEFSRSSKGVLPQVQGQKHHLFTTPC